MSLLVVAGWLITAVYLLAVGLLAGYGLHHLWLLWRLARCPIAPSPPLPLDRDEPVVLVQLPIFNERDVVERLLTAVGGLDWPADRLRLQLLDDSTDDTSTIAAAAVARLRRQGLDVAHVRRADRQGYKAGALAHGLALDAGDARGAALYVAIFDADFVPGRDFLRQALASLVAEPRAAFVQGRWEHLNADASWLTRAQALGTDGHFAVEQAARAWTGLAMNFNGTGGVWRCEAIAGAGGWRPDTLTEDLDLSYRARLAGWTAVYRRDLAVPAELPPTLEAWRSQQFRWAKGSLQTAVKLLPDIWRSSWSLGERIAATVHLTHYLVHPLMVVSLALAPVAVPMLAGAAPVAKAAGLLFMICGMLPPIAMYLVGQRLLRRSWRRCLALPALVGFGTGIAVANTLAAWQALRGIRSAFERTPKRGDGVSTGSYRAPAASGLPELAAAAWGGLGLAVAWTASPWLMPILALYVLGFLDHGLRLFAARLGEALPSERALPWPLLAAGVVALAVTAAMAVRDGSWREEPGLFAALALVLGGACLVGLALARRRPLGAWSLAWVLIVAAGLHLLGAGLWHSDDVNRYAVEGAQILAGVNPYAVPPAASAHLVDPAIAGQVNHPQMTAIYPPAALAVHTLAQAWWPGIAVFTVLGVLGSAAVVVLVLALLLRTGLAPGLVVAVAWNPVLVVFACGEAHHDVLMAAGVLLAVLLAVGGSGLAAVAVLSLAALTKPFAVAALPALLSVTGWRWWWVPPVLAVAAVLPFADAGAGLVASLFTFGGAMQFHGALEPWVRLGVDAVLGPWLGTELVGPAVRVVLFALLAAGAVWLWARRGAAALPTLVVRSLALLLLCLPTLHPWYLIVVAALLPFARTWALPLWTCLAGVYWLHGLAMLDTGVWTETPWVTAAAHLPVVLLMIFEVVGPLREPAEPGRLGLLPAWLAPKLLARRVD